MNQEKHYTLLNQATGHADPEIIAILQTLWNDQGTCVRYKLPNGNESFVAKVITPNRSHSHPKGWNSEISYLRKRKSYAVERQFYTHYQPLLDESVMTASMLRMYQADEDTVLILEDLNTLGFDTVYKTLSHVEPGQAVMTWLARFHARFIHANAKHLWPHGTYWQWETRQDEWHAMEVSLLKQKASAIHGAIHNSVFKTLVHGDAKVANFCFAPDTNTVAAVDFQYVGAGIGVQDVAYFIGSAYSEEQQQALTPLLLDFYFCELSSALAGRLSENDIQLLVDEWRQKYAIVNADFLRFLKGWNPEHWKINRLIETYTEQALSSLKKGELDV